MATVPSSIEVPFVTFAHVVNSLPDIPLERIRLSPTPGTATLANVLVSDRSDRQVCELIDGVLVEKTVGAYESWLAIEIAALLREFAMAHDLGIVLGEAGTLQILPNQVRAPDVCFISWTQLPGKAFPREPIPSLHPDLAVEAMSAGNTRSEMDRKLRDYFQAGTRLVWYFDANRREVQVFTSPDAVRTVGETGILDGGEVLPGLELPLAKVFRVPRG